jgi:hypothetical protein
MVFDDSRGALKVTGLQRGRLLPPMERSFCGKWAMENGADFIPQYKKTA